MFDYAIYHHAVDTQNMIHMYVVKCVLRDDHIHVSLLLILFIFVIICKPCTPIQSVTGHSQCRYSAGTRGGEVGFQLTMSGLIKFWVWNSRDRGGICHIQKTKLIELCTWIAVLGTYKKHEHCKVPH